MAFHTQLFVLSGVHPNRQMDAAMTPSVTPSITPFIQKLLARPCITVTAGATSDEVIRLLAKHNIGAVVVVTRTQRLAGIISERDIVRRLDQSVHISDLSASDLMTGDVISVGTDVTSADLMKIMTENKCRHLPILSEGKLVGMVSIGDVVKRLLEKYQSEVEQMRSFINS